jgi:hypothetical protein
MPLVNVRLFEITLPASAHPMQAFSFICQIELQNEFSAGGDGISAGALR